MIYASYFDKDYLEIEQKKKLVETKIALVLTHKLNKRQQKYLYGNDIFFLILYYH